MLFHTPTRSQADKMYRRTRLREREMVLFIYINDITALCAIFPGV